MRRGIIKTLSDIHSVQNLFIRRNPEHAHTFKITKDLTVVCDMASIHPEIAQNAETRVYRKKVKP